MTSRASPPPVKLPDLHLLCLQAEASKSFGSAVLKLLDKHLRFSAVVSPANSYDRLDGSFDDALARALQPNPQDYDRITRKAQAVVYEKWRGFAPPGTCSIVRLDHENSGDAAAKNPWGTEYLLLCPTMRTLSLVTWDREIVYECIWSMLCAVDNHNRELRQANRISSEITCTLMTPLATGCGRVPNIRWIEQCVLAMKHWVEAVEKPEVWSRVTWDVVTGRDEEVEATWS